MLDVHPPHHAATTWRDSFVHIATIVIGLLVLPIQRQKYPQPNPVTSDLARRHLFVSSWPQQRMRAVKAVLYAREKIGP
jgi:hypothetical protein